MRWLALCALLLTVACGFGGGFDNTHYHCGAGGRCPEGQTCVADYCEAAPIDAPCTGNGCDGGNTTTCGGLAMLQDRFDTAGPGGYWYDFSDPGVTATETGGQLVIALAAGTNDVYGGYESVYFYDLNESEITAKVSQVGGHDTILEARDENGGKAQLVVEDGQLIAGVFDVAGAGTRRSIAYDPSQIYWRIRVTSDVMYWETSSDGTSWNELHHEAAPIDARHVQGVVSAGGQLAAASAAKFDEVNASPPAGSVLCPVSDLVDGFDTAAFAPWWQEYADNNPPCTISRTGGALAMSFGGTGSSFCGIEARHLYSMATGSMVIDSAMLPAGRTNFVSYLQALSPDNDQTRVEIGLDSTFLNLVNQVNGTEGPSTSLTYDPVMHRYWRIAGAGTQVHFDTSPDGASWTTRLTATPSFDLHAAAINFGAGHYATVANPAGAVTAHLPGFNAP